jgi:RNA polymerase sigma-70 factor (ECF subfamily)
MILNFRNQNQISAYIYSEPQKQERRLNDNEQAWLVLAQKGDDEAFTHLVETYQKPVYNLCYRMLGDPQEAEDATQETFWRAYQGLGRYDMQRSFITWLLSIAAHYCIDQQRRRRLPIIGLELLPEGGAPDPTPGPERKFVRSEEDRLVRKLLGELGPQDRAALVLRYWYDFSDQEIANALSLSVSAVKSRLHRSRQVLAQRWKKIQPPQLMKEEAA